MMMVNKKDGLQTAQYNILLSRRIEALKDQQESSSPCLRARSLAYIVFDLSGLMKLLNNHLKSFMLDMEGHTVLYIEVRVNLDTKYLNTLT